MIELSTHGPYEWQWPLIFEGFRLTEAPWMYYCLKLDIREWFENLEIEYSAIFRILVFENTVSMEGEINWSIASFILDFKNSKDEILFKLTWM